MIRKFNIVLILGLSFFFSPSHSQEIQNEKTELSSKVEKIAEEMTNLNSNLDLLSITISNLLS
jgi:hypothetical protein